MGRIKSQSNDTMITLVRIGDTEVGIVSVGEVFERIYQGKKKPEEIERIELVRELSDYNFVPDGSWNEYAEVLISEYEKYYNKKILGH
ncbi:MAG: hypothetical protein OIN86_11750 [Candidatus Methanoperedens sp.]|nr:hypothetical protein [Candidatus Methanoperedens sp.]CAG0991331.1 hypothetical protein METP1_02313 [Methanosarcinales archaeon]